MIVLLDLNSFQRAALVDVRKNPDSIAAQHTQN
jgi:hypothetical protein